MVKLFMGEGSTDDQQRHLLSPDILTTVIAVVGQSDYSGGSSRQAKGAMHPYVLCIVMQVSQ